MRDINHMPELLERIAVFNDLEEVVGLFGSSGDAPSSAAGLSMAELGAVHEYGTDDGHIPARPWVSVGAEMAANEVEKMFAEGLDAVLDGKLTPGELLDRAGLLVETEIKDYASNPTTPPPPNAPATIARKGSSNPLIDTGRMVGSVTHANRKRGDDS